MITGPGAHAQKLQQLVQSGSVTQAEAQEAVQRIRVGEEGILEEEAEHSAENEARCPAGHDGLRRWCGGALNTWIEFASSSVSSARRGRVFLSDSLT